MSPIMTERWFVTLLMLSLVIMAVACGGGGGGDEIVIDFPTIKPLTEPEIRATLLVELTPPTPTPDVQSTLAASLQGTMELWPTAVSRDDAPDGYYLNPRDVEYLKIFGPVIWHSSRVDLLVSGLYIGYVSDNQDLDEFFAQYELVDRPEQWKCHERLRQAVHREMLNLRREHETLAKYQVKGVSRAVLQYSVELRQALRAADVTGNAFLRIQSEVCNPGYEPGQLSEKGLESRRGFHDEIATNTAIFHRLMAGYGCVICGELYRR